MVTSGVGVSSAAGRLSGRPLPVSQPSRLYALSMFSTRRSWPPFPLSAINLRRSQILLSTWGWQTSKIQLKLFVHSFACLFVHSFINLFIHSFVYSLICSFIRSFSHLSVHACVHSPENLITEACDLDVIDMSPFWPLLNPEINHSTFTFTFDYFFQLKIFLLEILFH